MFKILRKTAQTGIVTISQDVSYDFLSPVSSLATLTAGQTLITNFGSSTVGNNAVYSLASGYGFSWVTDNTVVGSPEVTTVFDGSSSSFATGIYGNGSLISGISAPPPGRESTPAAFICVRVSAMVSFARRAR